MTAYMLSRIMKVILDTNIIISAIQAGDQLNRQLLRLAFLGEITPLVSTALFLEYEAITQRREIMKNCHFTASQAEQFLDSLFSVCQWVDIYFSWRPNLKDEGDNFLIELAVAGNADYLITKNIRDLKHGELIFPQLNISTPQEFMQVWRAKT